MSDDDTWQEEFGIPPKKAPPPSMAVVTAVAEAEGVNPSELPPLYDVVDPEALDSLFRRHDPGSIEFSYNGYQVTLVDGRAVVQQQKSE